jgi:seryl-tRNA synthetase
MLDMNYIRENEAAIREALEWKNLSLDLGTLLSVDDERRSLMQQVEALYAKKNEVNEGMKSAKTPEERAPYIEQGKTIKEKTEKLEPELRELKEEWHKLMVQVPNVLSPDTIRGKSEDDNKEVYQKGEKRIFDFTPKTHIELAEDLGLIDFDRGVKTAGYRGYYLTGDGAMLTMALMHWAMAELSAAGFRPMIVPTLVKGAALFGSGYFKGTEYNAEVDEVYQVASPDKNADGTDSKEDKFLAGTAEPSLLHYYAGEVLEESALPIRLVGYSPCYRSEIGSYGKDTKGLYRVHEFYKVEQVILTTADVALSTQLHDQMVGYSEMLHTKLGLSYRKLAIASGDMSAGKYRAFDLEAWMPGMNRWGETGSASNFLDWQARRLNVKYTDAKTGERKYVYMLNNTALPSPRTLIALLENYQNADGSITIPEVLRPYVGKDRITKPQ